jgi:hypothetical protein
VGYDLYFMLINFRTVYSLSYLFNQLRKFTETYKTYTFLFIPQGGKQVYGPPDGKHVADHLNDKYELLS